MSFPSRLMCTLDRLPLDAAWWSTSLMFIFSKSVLCVFEGEVAQRAKPTPCGLSHAVRLDARIGHWGR